MENINIGNILKNMRNINTKYTQKDMGEKLSLYDTTISSYERGNSQPDFQTILKYAEICGFEIQIVNKKTGKQVSIEDLSKEL